jgi:hypothetical protein
MKERIPGCICELNEQTGEPIVEKYEMCPVHKPEAPSPKNEANGLVNKFYMLRAIEVMSDIQRKTAYEIAKESATIYVNELLNVLESFQRHEYAKILIPFYHEVRKEIEAL